MNLALLREYEKRFPPEVPEAKPERETVQSTFPLIGCTALSRTTGDAAKYDPTQVSKLCEIGPNAAHSRCTSAWCKCPCHEWHDGYGEFM